MAVARWASAVAMAALVCSGSLRAQETFAPQSGPYDPSVPTVAALRGFATGATFSTYRDIERVLEGLDQASERIRLETYGNSVEGRPLRLAWVSSPANLDRLDELRALNRELIAGHSDTTRIDNRPIFVWLSFGVHGDEASSPEAALELLYHLGATRETGVSQWLDRAVIIVDPLLNPDGHERYAAWYRSVAGITPDPDPSAREHRPPWPSGRTNHYYFDLNRDWAWGTQIETRARREVFLATLPQVHVDFHEMDPESSYFFFPPAAPVHAFYPPSTAKWGNVFGAANASAFDERGWPYYTEEDFDLFYPGYGDSWPSFFGATGMTYEQAGGGSAGVTLKREDGTRLTLAERVEHHFIAALTTIATAVTHREERLADFSAFWRPETRVPPSTPAAYLVPRENPAADSLAAMLDRQGVWVDTLASSLPTAPLDRYPGTPARETLPPGTYVFRSDQPLGRYLAALMAPDAALPDTSLFYDITGWTLPYLYDVPAYSARVDPGAPAHRWHASPVVREEPNRRESITMGDEGAGEDVATADGAVALAWPYASLADVVAAARLAGSGWNVRVATRPFRAVGREWSPGSFVVLLASQPDSLDAPRSAPAAIAAAGAHATALSSFQTEDGSDLGSGRFRLLRTPRIALAGGPATDATSVGAGWHLLAVEAGLAIDVVWAEDVAAGPEMEDDSLAGRGRQPLDLDRYTAIVLPDGPGVDAWAAALGIEGIERLEEWIASGGTLIGLRTGAAWLTKDESGLSDVEMAEEPEEKDEDRLRPEALRETDELRRRIPGTLLLVNIDSTSPLGYGYDDGQAAVLVREPTEFVTAESGNAWTYVDQPALSGYLPAAARDRLKETPYAVVDRQGRGRVVLLADDPAFRGLTHALKKLYLNAVVLVPGS